MGKPFYFFILVIIVFINNVGGCVQLYNPIDGGLVKVAPPKSYVSPTFVPLLLAGLLVPKCKSHNIGLILDVSINVLFVVNTSLEFNV
jgi:hypothetical protein